MKKFKDLQVGDSIIVGFEKKTITKIISDNDDSDEGIEIYISEDEFYYVSAFLSVDYCYDAAEWIFAGKDAIINRVLHTKIKRFTN